LNLQKSNKIFYSIGEVSKLTEVKPNILRYWENFFTDLKSIKKMVEEDITGMMRLKLFQQSKT